MIMPRVCFRANGVAVSSARAVELIATYSGQPMLLIGSWVAQVENAAAQAETLAQLNVYLSLWNSQLYSATAGRICTELL